VASAQVKSAVLLAGLSASGTTGVDAPLPSRDHTERLLRYLGRDVLTAVGGDGRERTTLGEGELSAAPIAVSGDPSSAAFWWVAAAVAGDGPGVTVTHVNLNPRRTGVLDVLVDLGAEVERGGEHELAGEPVGDVTVRPGPLRGAEVSGTTAVDALDELSLLALAGAVSDLGLSVSGASELRVKESDRIEATARALRGLGIEVETRPDGLRVPGRQRPTGGTVEARGDHRIAMLGAVAGTIASGPVDVTGFGAVATSYPTFLADLSALGGRHEVLEEQESP
jgi:3-phosphoshikimate 1-carboxyvinyltransferase